VNMKAKSNAELIAIFWSTADAELRAAAVAELQRRARKLLAG